MKIIISSTKTLIIMVFVRAFSVSKPNLRHLILRVTPWFIKCYYDKTQEENISHSRIEGCGE